MKNYNYVKDTVVRDAKTPVLMMCYHTDVGEKPDFLIPIGSDIWVCEHDEFFDAGLDENAVIIPVGHGLKGAARAAYEYFYMGADSGEYGESMEHFEDEHRRHNFAILYKAMTGKELVFKLKEVG